MNLSKVNNIRLNRLKDMKNSWIFLLFLISSLIIYFTPIDIYYKARIYSIAYIIMIAILLINVISGPASLYKFLLKRTTLNWTVFLAFLFMILNSLIIILQYDIRTNAILNKDGVTCFGIVTKVEKEKGKTYFRASYFYNGKEYRTFRERDYSGDIKERDSIEFIVSFSSPEIYKIKN